MKIGKTYYLVPPFFQNIAFSVYGSFVYTRRYNTAFKNRCEILKKNESLAPEEHRRNQLRQLKTMLEHCAKNVPYYQKLFRRIGFEPSSMKGIDDLKQIPILEKKDVLKNPEAFVVENIKKKDLILEETSGTSGSSLKVYWHKDFYPWIYALYETRMRGSAGVDMNDRRANLTGKVLVPANQKKPPFWRYNMAEKQLYMSSYHLSSKNIPYYVEALQKFKPKFIIGYPGSICPIAKYLVDSKDMVSSIKSVISCSEYLSSQTRTIIEKGFDCKVYNHYGSVEWVTTLNECEAGRLHLSPEFGIVEILDSNNRPRPRGQTGEMVCTGLMNYAMPFIRYKTGDMGAYPETDEKCPCGRALPIFKSLEGRKMSFLSLPNGNLVSSAALSTAFHAENILESQLIQESLDSICLKLVVNNRFTNRDRDCLFTELKKRISPLTIRCEYADSIPCEKGGKRPWIVNRCINA